MKINFNNNPLAKTNFSFYMVALFMLTIAIKTHAQPVAFDWAIRFGYVDDDKGNGITTDVSGNVYTIGNFNGTFDIDPGVGVVNLVTVGYTDIYIAKWDASGNLIWARSFGGSVHDNGTSLFVDGSGNVYATGSFANTCDFDPGPNVSNLTSAGGLDMFILKLDATGNFVWVKQIGGSQISAIGGEEGKSIKLDNAGNIFVLGRFEGTVDFDPGSGITNLVSPGGFGNVFVLKLNAQGNFVWANQWGATANNDWVNTLALDDSANVYSTGSFYSNIDFDPGAGVTMLAPAGLAGVYVSKLDSSGNFIWARQFSKQGGFVQDVGSMTIDNQGNVYTTGTFSGTIDFNPGAGSNNLTAGSGSNGFIAKLNSSGNYVWAKSLGGPGEVSSQTITTDVYGNVYTAGWFSDFNPNTDFDPGNGTFILTSAGYWDVYVCKLDATGNFVWAKGWGGTLEDNAQSVAVDAASNIYSTGYFSGTVDFDPTAAVFSLTGAGSADVFIHKMGQIGVGIDEPADMQSVIVFPNPSNGNFSIHFAQTISHGIIQMYDLHGKKIVSDYISNQSKNEMKLDNLADGLYLLKIMDGEKLFSRKILIQKE